MNLFCLADDLCHLDETQPLTVMQEQGESQQCQFHKESTHPPSTPVDMNVTTYHLDVQLLHYGSSWYRFLQNFTCNSVNIKKLVVNTVKCFAGDVYIVLILISHSAG